MSHGINSSKVQRRLRGLDPKRNTSKVAHGGRGKKYGLKSRKRSKRPQK